MDLEKNGGARRNRTDDLLHAMQALSQLSYSPKAANSSTANGQGRAGDKSGGN